MSRKIALITAERQAEALRMALGLTLLSDEAEVYLLAPPQTEQDAVVNQLRHCQEAEIPVFCTAEASGGLEQIELEEAAARWTLIDRVHPLLP